MKTAPVPAGQAWGLLGSPASHGRERAQETGASHAPCPRDGVACSSGTVDGTIIAHLPANVTGPMSMAETRTQPQSAQPHPPTRLPEQVQCGGSRLVREAHSWMGRGPGPMGRATAKRSRSLEGRQPSGLTVKEREGLHYVYKSFEDCGDRAPPSGWTLDTRCLHFPPAPVPAVGVGPCQSSAGHSLCSWAWGPHRVLSQPCPGAEPMAASSPCRGPCPWGHGQCSVISFRLTAVRFSAVQPGQCGVAPRRLGPPCALLPTCCRVATVAGKPCGLGGGTGRFPVSSGQPCPACRGRGRVIL